MRGRATRGKIASQVRTNNQLQGGGDRAVVKLVPTKLMTEQIGRFPGKSCGSIWAPFANRSGRDCFVLMALVNGVEIFRRFLPKPLFRINFIYIQSPPLKKPSFAASECGDNWPGGFACLLFAAGYKISGTSAQIPACSRTTHPWRTPKPKESSNKKKPRASGKHHQPKTTDSRVPPMFQDGEATPPPPPPPAIEVQDSCSALAKTLWLLGEGFEAIFLG